MTDNITTYLEKVELHKQVLFRIRDGIGYYVVAGVEFTKNEWEATNPVPLYIRRSNRENIDGTTSWIHE